jgi:hypothetical protein
MQALQDPLKGSTKLIPDFNPPQTPRKASQALPGGDPKNAGSRQKDIQGQSPSLSPCMECRGVQN